MGVSARRVKNLFPSRVPLMQVPFCRSFLSDHWLEEEGVSKHHKLIAQWKVELLPPNNCHLTERFGNRETPAFITR